MCNKKKYLKMSENKRVLNKKMGNGLAVRDRKVFVKL